MKNTYMKKLVTVCIATFALSGLHHNTAKAITDYRVVEGDSLLEIGQLSNISIDELKQANNLQDDLIYIGEVLKIPDHEIITTAQPSTTITEATVQPAQSEIDAPVANREAQVMTISNEEKDLFTRLVEAEAKGETYQGKVAVATVVLNRVDSPDFPSTITEVINQVVGKSYAFSPVQNGEINKPASAESVQAVEEALLRKDRLNECIYFYNPDIATDKWIRTREVVSSIGNHVFAK